MYMLFSDVMFCSGFIAFAECKYKVKCSSIEIEQFESIHSLYIIILFPFPMRLGLVRFNISILYKACVM